MKFAMFFMAEYANMIMVGCVATLMFLGGWTSPFGNYIPPPQNIFVHALFPDFLVCVQGILLSVFVCLGARNAAALPL